MMKNRELIEELQLKLNEALQKLSPSHRSIVILNDIEGLPLEQIASITDLSEKKVHMRLKEAHQQLQKFLNPYLKKSSLTEGMDWQIQDLLLLKKLETPGKEYFDHFLAEFQRYQRTELLTEATHSRGILDIIGDWLFPISRPTLAWATALGVFAVVVGVHLNTGTQKDEGTLIPTVVKMDKVVNDPLPYEHGNFTDSSPNAYYTDAVRQQPELQKTVAYSESDLSYPRYVTGESSAPRETSLAF